MNDAYDPNTFFREYVLRAYDEWCAAPLDEFRAKTAVHQLNVLAERIWHRFHSQNSERVFWASNAGEYRNQLTSNECDEVNLIRDVDDGFKHVELDRPNRRVSRFDQTRLNRIGYGERGYGEGVYGGAEQLIIMLDDGTKRALTAVMENVLTMWRRLLESWDN
jgi:hypothetical protein